MGRPNAAVAGMHDDLQTNKGYRYSIATLVFFITYTVFQPPATVVTYKIGPRLFLPSLCVLWGIVMVGERRPYPSQYYLTMGTDRLRLHQ